MWGGLADDLAADIQLVLVDLPGHGGSSAVRVGLVRGGRSCWVRRAVRADYLGYSMGARFCLHLALARPDWCAAWSWCRARPASMTPMSAPSGGVPTTPWPIGSTRRTAGRADTVAAFVDRWVANPMFGDVPAPANDLDERKRNSAAGLASSLRLAGTGTQEPLWDRLGELHQPVLVVVGSRDAKFTELGRRLVAGIGAERRRWW